MNRVKNNNKMRQKQTQKGQKIKKRNRDTSEQKGINKDINNKIKKYIKTNLENYRKAKIKIGDKTKRKKTGIKIGGDEKVGIKV